MHNETRTGRSILRITVTLLACVVVGVTVLTPGCSTKHIVRPVTSADAKLSKGIFYALPRTVLSVECTLERTTTSRSTLMGLVKDADLANVQDYVHTELEIPRGSIYTNPVASTSCSVANAALSTSAEPDPERVYYVEIKGGWFKNRHFNAKFTENGLLSSAESKVEDKTLDFALKFLETGASLAGKVIGLGKGITERAKATDALKRITNVVEEIEQIRATRRTILQTKALGPASVQPGTLEIALRELDQREKALLAVFTGATRKETLPVRFDVRPSTGAPCEYALLAWNATNKFILLPHPAVTPPAFDGNVMLDTTDTNDSPERLTVKLDFNPPKAEQLFNKVTTVTNGCRSYYYRVPAIALGQVFVQTLKKDGQHWKVTSAKESARGRFAVAQFGTVASLPASIAASSSTFKPTFYVNSGALQEIDIDTKVPDAATVGSLGTAGGTILDAIAKQRQAEREASDELNRLKREADLLEQQVRIKKAKEALEE